VPRAFGDSLIVVMLPYALAPSLRDSDRAAEKPSPTLISCWRRRFERSGLISSQVCPRSVVLSSFCAPM
jgi:hypothetical protein